MQLGVWIYILMIILGFFSYYLSEPIMKLMPQDKDGYIVWPFQSMPVLLDIGGLGLMMFGFLYAKHACETELINRHKQREN